MHTALTSRAIAAPPRGAKAHRRRRMRGAGTTARASSSGRTGDDDAPDRSSSSSRSRNDGGFTRRAALAGYALSPAALSFLAAAPPSAHAKLDIIYDGELQTAYTFPVQLQVIALRGSVASQWEGEFNKTMLGKGKASVTTAISPGEMFDELLRTAPPPSFPGGYISPADYIAGKRPPPGVPPPPPPPSNKDKKKSKGAPKYLKADVVSVGDEFLAAAVTRGLVLPLDPSVVQNEWYARLPYAWRELATRDPRTGYPSAPAPPAPPGRYPNTTAVVYTNGDPDQTAKPAMYGVPYRWGCTLIAYRKDKLPASLRERPPRDWDDLWRPEFKRRVGMGSGPRQMLTAALRAEGMSANADGWGGGGNVRARLESLRREQLLIQDDVQYLQALGNGDAWIAVGNSDDVLSMARKSSLIGVVVPMSGTTLFADVWCVPASAARKPGGVSPLTNQWFDYTTQPARVNLRVGLRGGVSPIVFDGGGIDYASIGMNGPTGGFVDYDAAGDKNGTRGMGAKIKDFLSRDEKNRGGEIMQGGMPPDEVWARSEFLYPLSPRIKDQYNELMREWAAEASTRKPSGWSTLKIF
ncbi:ATP-binding cassette superfamily [Micromonas commoda]|uniref:ATP-binding cassette superfamily n=1 Tax=Micromonas commoda (strain RCC299 / NOUM17 / CCMP2709) TaxID=296587 RepID=C1E2J4_MICCC|nr:ATP-binding cassette superfamily [Micromonas commoda]ACO61924.1 ATP-binding cassette superfamily [Micromonas commoda]|eukprot:XP_002500666.1 ATP-binding cassette superfamily [Micromonas commoda]